MAPHARSVIFDVDSTLCGIEGIDWLAALRSPAVTAEIATMTREAMAGERALEAVYGARLELVAPTRSEVERLSEEYLATLAPDAPDVLDALRDAGLRLVLVSGGVRQALLPLAARLGIAAEDVHAVTLLFDADGRYLDFDHTSPLTQQRGKATLVRTLALPRPVLAIGDGSTDLAIRTARACDIFAAFTGFERREAVVIGADLECASFEALQRYLLGTV